MQTATDLPITRPVIRYFGGKWRYGPWIARELPPHKVYVEPFGGGASVLLRKPRAPMEVYNDLDSEIVNLFRVLRHPDMAAELRRLASLTPYSREELLAACEPTDDPVERARRTVIRYSYARPGSWPTSKRPEFRYGYGHNRGPNQSCALTWRGWPSHVESWVNRLRGTVIENTDAHELIERVQGPNVLFYCDPPYPASSRAGRGKTRYTHELKNDEEHRKLAELLHEVNAMVVLSGYRCDLYDELYSDWKQISHPTPTIHEILWLNRAAVEAKGQLDLPL